MLVFWGVNYYRAITSRKAWILVNGAQYKVHWQSKNLNIQYIILYNANNCSFEVHKNVALAIFLAKTFWWNNWQKFNFVKVGKLDPDKNLPYPQHCCLIRERVQSDSWFSSLPRMQVFNRQQKAIGFLTQSSLLQSHNQTHCFGL
jgi:hypothetical protein